MFLFMMYQLCLYFYLLWYNFVHFINLGFFLFNLSLFYPFFICFNQNSWFLECEHRYWGGILLEFTPYFTIVTPISTIFRSYFNFLQFNSNLAYQYSNISYPYSHLSNFTPNFLKSCIFLSDFTPNSQPYTNLPQSFLILLKFYLVALKSFLFLLKPD